MTDLHKFQALILKKFIFNRLMSYGEMKPSRLMENNKFQFHLDQLIKKRLVEKVGIKYQLTKAGKQFINRMDSKKAKIETQTKLATAIHCTRMIDGKREFLVYTRLKQPFYGCQGFMAGKVHYGETIEGAAMRELKEETKLSGETKLLGIYHYLTTQKGVVIDDQILFWYWVENPKGKLEGCKEGKYQWVREDKVEDIVTKPFRSREEFFDELDLVRKYDGKIKMKEIGWEDEKEENF